MKKLTVVLLAVLSFCLISATGSSANVPGVISDNVNLRQSPTKFSNSLGVLGKGTSLTILEFSKENRSGEYFLWLKVAVGSGGVGWVNADYVATSVTGKVGETNVNLRNLPSPKSKSKGVFPRGTSVQCLGFALDQSDVSLPLWCKVKLNSGANGWIRSDLLAFGSSGTGSSQKKTAMSDTEFAEFCGRGAPQQIEAAIKAGANVNATIGEAGSALGVAASDNPNLEVIKILIRAGADVNGDHALISAAGNPNPEVIKTFIRAGADVNKELYMGGADFTPLMAAAGNNSNPEVIAILIEAGADVNMNVEAFGTALMWAAGNKNPEITAILINAGADVHAKNDEGQTALMMAREQSNSRVVTLLVKAGAR